MSYDHPSLKNQANKNTDRLATKRERKTKFPSGAKARIVGGPWSARLKPSPFKTIYKIACETKIACKTKNAGGVTACIIIRG